MKLLWLARAPAPYRYPIWRSLAERRELRVAFLHPRGLNRSWRVLPGEPFEQVVLPAWGLRYREDALWVLRPWWRKFTKDVGAVVFQGAWETPAFWQVLVWSRRRGLRRVLFYESTLAAMHHPSGLARRARSTFMAAMDAVVTPGPAATAAVLSHGVPSDRVLTSVNPVDVDWFRAAAQQARGELGEVQGHVFLVAAQLISRKRVDLVIECFGRIREPHDTLLIAGRGPEESRLRELTAARGLSDAVTFIGHLEQEELAQVYGRAQTLILASAEEVWGLVANEALAAGLHAVVTENCGVAPSIEGMPGVFVVASTENAVCEGMAASRAGWRGWIGESPILTHTGERLALDIEEALNLGGNGGER